MQNLREDKNGEYRGYAAYLLAFTDHAQSYVKTITPSRKDPDSLVRNNAMRVIVAIARNYPTIELPVQEIVEAFQYPDTTDRNKAAFILVKMAKQEKYRSLLSLLIEQAVPIFLKMLRLDQPNNHEI
ncbi:MAG: hypothetical protein ACFB16_18040 [Phormidesmis sp.]